MKKIIDTTQAPSAAWRVFSQGVIAGDMLYVSWQIATDPDQGFIWWDIEQQTHQVMKNLQAICDAADTNLEKYTL